MLLIWAMSVAVLTPVSSANTKKNPDGTVYCPLTKTFQPIETTSKKKARGPFDYLCASAKTKDFLFREIILKNPLRAFSLDASGIEKLTFELLAKGKTAPEKLREFPNTPAENRIKPAGTTAAVNGRSEHRSVWKHSFEIFLPTRAARPPTGEKTVFYQSRAAFKATDLARRLAPRAPPSFS